MSKKSGGRPEHPRRIAESGPRELVLPDSTYQPSKAEMSETVGFDGSLEELAQALFQPFKIRRVKDWKL